MTRSLSSDVALLLSRISLGLYFAIAGTNKIFGVGAGNFAEMNLPNVPSWFAFAGKPYLMALPIVEFIVGAALVLGFFTRAAALLSALMLVSFLIAMAKPTVIYGITTSQVTGPPFDANVILLTLTLVLAAIGPGGLSADRLLWAKRTLAAASQNPS